MGLGVDILIAIAKKQLHYSLFVKRIIAVEAQLYLWAWPDYRHDANYASQQQIIMQKFSLSDILVCHQRFNISKKRRKVFSF